MFVVDTNILLYAVDSHAVEHKICRDFVQKCRKQISPWHLTWGIVYEFLRVATHPRVFQNPMSITQAWQFVQSIMASPNLSLLVETGQHSEIASLVFDEVPLISGNLVFDTHTAILMREHGITKIFTRDTDFHRFPFLKVIDPLK